MAKDTDRLEEALKDYDKRLRAVETAIALQGLKVGAIVVLLIGAFSALGAVISHKLSWLAKWWSSQ